MWFRVIPREKKKKKKRKKKEKKKEFEERSTSSMNNFYCLPLYIMEGDVSACEDLEPAGDAAPGVIGLIRGDFEVDRRCFAGRPCRKGAPGGKEGFQSGDEGGGRAEGEVAAADGGRALGVALEGLGAG